MSVWKSDKKLRIFASLTSPSKISLFEKSYQAFDTVFHHQVKHLEVRQKYFNSLLGDSSGDETLRLRFDLLLHYCCYDLTFIWYARRSTTEPSLFV